MIQLSTLTVILVGEVLLALLIALVVLVLIGARRRRQDRQAALHLAGHIRDNEPGRLAETRDLLLKAYRYPEARADQTAHALLRAEKQLYQRMLNLYITRDTAALRQLHVPMDELTGGFRGLEVPKGGGAPEAPAAEPIPDALLEKLRRENESLRQELQVTMETMGRMLSEYASMFSAGGGAIPGLPGDLPEADLEEDGFGMIQELEMQGPGKGDKEAMLDDLGPLWGDGEVTDPMTQTLVLPNDKSGAGDVDLSGDLDDLFAAPTPAASQKGPPELAPDMDLDDIWAEALAEQEASGAKPPPPKMP